MPLGSASIIIPGYDGADLTRVCASRLFETVDAHLDIEVIAVDDCSSDGTADVLDALAASQPRPALLHNRENRASSTRATGGPPPLRTTCSCF